MGLYLFSDIEIVQDTKHINMEPPLARQRMYFQSTARRMGYSSGAELCIVV